MSTVAEIESAIGKLPADELRQLLDRLLARVAAAPAPPKTGAELARLWPGHFHLSSAEAESLAADLDEIRARQRIARPSAWE